ncbi:MAG: branched-chain-amino-acid transaminase [Bacteroidetes bacterium]|nr:MAG: branched-chain-amino-acid transaminase [Bacteroidota bacterium]
MANYYNPDTIIYSNGKLVKAAECTIDLYSQTLHYGLGVFEGIRSYRLQDGSTGIFKAEAHYNRLEASARALHMPYIWSSHELTAATYSVLQANNLQDAYIRPLVYGPANMSFNFNTESNLAIMAWPMQPFLGDKLLRVFTSSVQRPNPKGFNMRVKACGHYVNSIMASYEAKQHGYDEALLLDLEGNVSEAPGANVFIEKNGQLITPPAGNILPGITRATVLELCATLHIPVQERHFTLAEMKTADSAFFCGTAAEIIGIQSIDAYSFPTPWPEAKGHQLQQAYQQCIRQAS